MSAAVCGSKRSFFEDLPSPSSSSKRARCSSSSPVRFSPPSLVDQLRAVFPHMETQFLEKALEECGNDIDSAIKRLHELCLGSTNDFFLEKALEECGNDIDSAIKRLHELCLGSTNDFFLEKALEECGNDIDSAIKRLHELCLGSTNDFVSAEEVDINAGKGVSTNEGDVAATSAEVPPVQSNLPADGAEWVELFVREMMSATSVDNARDRAARVLDILEKSISSRAGGEIAQNLQKENIMLKEQFEVMIRENTILKRAVSIQHERQKEFEDKNQELQQLRQLVSQYQEQIRNLEVNNYALTMHLAQAQQSNSMPGRFHPDVF